MHNKQILAEDSQIPTPSQVIISSTLSHYQNQRLQDVQLLEANE